MKKVIFAALAASMVLLASCGGQQGKKAEATPEKGIGIQLYSVGAALKAEGVDTVFKALGEMGYKYVEAAGYNDQDGTLHGLKPEEYKAKLEQYGLQSLGSHTGKPLSDEELQSGDFSKEMEWWDKAIAVHKAAGCKYIVTAYFPMPSDLKGLQVYCDYFNAIGKKCAENGIQYGYHNHSHEFNKLEDQVIYTYLIEHTDPQYVFFEMDVYWAIMGHAYPVELFKKYPGRFKMLHIKDHRELGASGMVNFESIFNNAETAGLQDYIVEIEGLNDKDWKEVCKACADYLLNAPFVKESYSE